MDKNNVIALKSPRENSEDPLSELLRSGAKKLIAEAVEAELQELLAQYAELRNEKGQRLVVRNGYLPERDILTGIGEVEVRIPKVRDKSGQRIKFNSVLVPPYLRKCKNVEDLLPWLYLKGISTGDFQEALHSLLGVDAKGLSSSVISRCKRIWEEEHEAWDRRSLEGNRYVYIWADGIYFNIRSDDARQCILVIIGVTEQGRKEFIAIEDGYRESEQSWSELLLRLKAQGLKHGPKLAVQKPVINVAGFIRPPMCSTSCRRVSNPRLSRPCMRFGWHRPRKRLIRPSIQQSRHIQPSTPRPCNAWKKTKIRCWLSMISRPRIGNIYGRATQ
jgi:transposase-like protein